MLNSFEFIGGSAVFSKDEFAFRRVIDDFNNTKYIGILTYNISANSESDYLTDKLKEACVQAEKVDLITNIPKRFSSYCHYGNAVQAKKAIDDYIYKLNPENYGACMSVYFYDKNHAKIILNDNLIYIGSANFSSESRKNSECGIISEDKDLISYVKNSLFPEIIETAMPYYKFDLISAIEYLKAAKNFCKKSGSEIFYSLFEPLSDYETNFKEKWVYVFSEFRLSEHRLKGFIEEFSSFKEALEIIPKITMKEKESEEVNSLKNLYDSYKKDFQKMSRDFDAFFDNAIAAAKYDPDIAANRILEREYSAEAYDEDLDRFAALAVYQAQEKYNELIEKSESAVKGILRNLKQMEIYFMDMITCLKKLFYVNPEINNTGIV